MSEATMWSLTILGLVLIPVLILVIRKQWGLIRTNAETVPEPVKTETGKTTQLDLRESLQVIARLTLDDQVELSEASIRIKVLMDHLDSGLHTQEPYTVFEEVYAALQHMPTHAARKATDKKFIRKLDQQRFAIESRYRKRIRAGAQALLDRLESEN